MLARLCKLIPMRRGGAADCRYRLSERGRWGLAIAGLEPPPESPAHPDRWSACVAFSTIFTVQTLWTPGLRATVRVYRGV